MKYQSSHTIEKQLESLSERLKYLARDTNSVTSYIDEKIKSENLQFNLSLVIARIILKLQFIERSKDVFEDVVRGYNRDHGTNLTFIDFEKINWIRNVADEIVMPQLVSHFIWQVGYYENEGKPIGIPIDKTDVVRCLQVYHQQCFEGAKLTITRRELEMILSHHATDEVTIDFLCERKIIEFNSLSELYTWEGGEHSRHLRNEIASTLWLLIGGEKATDVEFRKYFKLIEGTQIHIIGDLEGYLSIQNRLKICELSAAFLSNEKDLLRSDNEFSKIWLDAEEYTHTDIGSEVPTVEFNYDSPFDFIESVNYHKWRSHGIFDYQRTRSFCFSLLRFIVHIDSKQPELYQNVLRILKDTSRPSLLWILYQDIARNYPKVIPYLLTDSELIPLAFRLIDKIELDKIFLSEQSNNEKQYREYCELKNQLWLEMFEFVLERFASTHLDDKEKGEVIAKILIGLTEKVFSFNSNDKNNVITHDSLRRRYDEALDILCNTRVRNTNVYPKPLINPRIIISLLPHIGNYMQFQLESDKPNYNDFLHLKSGIADLAIEILRLANLNFSDDEASEEQKSNIKIANANLIDSLQRYLFIFYSQTDIDVYTYDISGTEKRKAKRGINEFGFEIIDWGYLFLHMERNNSLDSFNDNFKASLDFNINKDKYDAQNKEQVEKIKLYLKSLLLGFISINQKRDLYEINSLPVKSTLIRLEEWIKHYSLRYSIDDLPEKRIDVFNEMLSVFGYDIYFQRLAPLLYRSINYFTEQSPDKFIEDFFSDSSDIGKMLAAINILDSKELQKIIYKRIEEVKIEDFIERCFTTTELQYALVEAVNSESHWELAKPLIDKIQSHFKRIKHNKEGIDDFLFEISLLLAFKEKDFQKLVATAIPTKEHYYPSKNTKGEQIKRFFVALFKLYNEDEYGDAIKQLNSLLSEDTKNIRYAFHLYRAETLRAAGNIEILSQAYQAWETFITNLADEEKKGLLELTEPIACNMLHYFAAIKDATQFDQTINRLSKRYLYDEEVVPVIYKFYVERDMHELAFDYIQKVKQYIDASKGIISQDIQNILNRSESLQLLQKYKITLERIRNLSPSSVPCITPEIINDKRELNQFILNELIQSLRIIKEKKEALKQVTHENRFNDFLQAILRFRFPIWGWSVHDQPRVGTSSGGADAGNADLVVQAGGTNIALIEAFILRDTKYTQTHILKCPQYIGTINRYYVVVYYLGDSINFEKKWSDYKSDVLVISYPPSFSIDTAIGFVDLINDFENVNDFRIAKTVHGNDKEMYHIVINLGV